MKEKINMKKIYKLMAFCALFGAGISSCDLDVEPTESISTETYWKTAKDAWYNLNAIYSNAIPGIGVYSDAFSDDVYCQYSWESAGSLFQQDGFSASNDAGWGFGLVRMCNIYLENVDNTDLSDDLKKRTKAEVRFARAMDYLSKVITFGDVPLVLEVLDFDSPYMTRTPAAEVKQFVLDELKAAAEDLPESYSGSGEFNEKGRITKYAALALRARAALYFGDYASAEADARAVMESGKYELFKVTELSEAQQKEADEMSLFVDFADDAAKDKFVKGMFSYESLWHTENANNNNPEYILSRQYVSDSWDYQDMTRYTLMRPNQLGGWSSVTPTQNLVDAYWASNGDAPSLASSESRAAAYKTMRADYDGFVTEFNKREDKGGLSAMEAFVKEKTADGSLTRYEYMQQYRNRDSRLYVSIMLPFKGWYETNYGTNFAYEWIKNGNNESKTGFNFRKTLSLEMDAANQGQATGDYPCIRYAEVLLIFAEARTEVEGYDAQVESALNQLRERCGMPNVPSGLSKEDALDLIRRERRIELAAEGFRSDDMSRYEDAYWQNAMNNVPIVMPDGENVITMKWSTRMRLKPVPQTALNVNPELTQNPGY